MTNIRSVRPINRALSGDLARLTLPDGGEHFGVASFMVVMSCLEVSIAAFDERTETKGVHSPSSMDN
jgi:hypothetical protein